MIRAVPEITAMAPYALADPGEVGMISLAQNESTFPPSPMALAAGEQAVKDGALYPDPDWTDLRAAIAQAQGLNPQHILCGAGSMELIGAVIRAFAGPGDAVLGTAYGYLFVATACQQAGAEYVTVAEPNMTVSVDLLLDAVTQSTGIVFLCNPGNPTGTRLVNSEVLRLRNGLPRDVMLVVDQAYAEFDSQSQDDLFALTTRGDTVVLRTFSKAYALASARVGWGIVPDAISREMRKLMNPNNVSGVSQAMAAAAMRDASHMQDIVTKTAAIRDGFRQTLCNAGFAIPKSHANFVLIPFANVAAATRADTTLRDDGLIMRGMGGYGLPQCLRATIGPADVMERAAQVLTA